MLCRMADALVLGAGIMGLSAAWALDAAGHRVTVVEQDEVPNPRGASVDVMTDCSGEPGLRTVRADVVVVAAGAIESARLLLASGLVKRDLDIDALGQFLSW